MGRLTPWRPGQCAMPSDVSGRGEPAGRADRSASELGLRPLDVLALVKRLDDAGATSELDTRLRSFAPETATQIDIRERAHLASERGAVRTFSDVLELARAVNALLATSRALEPKDLLAPEEMQLANGADRMTAEAAQRAGAAASALSATQAQVDSAIHASPIDPVALRDALRAASLFVPGAFPEFLLVNRGAAHPRQQRPGRVASSKYRRERSRRPHREAASRLRPRCRVPPAISFGQPRRTGPRPCTGSGVGG